MAARFLRTLNLARNKIEVNRKQRHESRDNENVGREPGGWGKGGMGEAEHRFIHLCTLKETFCMSPRAGVNLAYVLR
jgi:hypothetical protein